MFCLRVKVQLQYMNTGLHVCYLIKDLISYGIPVTNKIQILNMELIFTVLHMGYFPVKAFGDGCMSTVDHSRVHHHQQFSKCECTQI